MTNDAAITIILKNSELLLNRDRKANGQLLHIDSKSEEEARPDITHQALMMILDSPLNRHGKKLHILLYNIDGKIIQVDSTFRIPRTWKVFAKVMAAFLSNPKGELHPEGAEAPVLKLLQPPLSSHLLNDALIVSFNKDGKMARFADITHHLFTNKEVRSLERPLVLIVEAETKYISPPNYAKYYDIDVHHDFKPSFYGISAMVICNRLCNSLEEYWMKETTKN